MTANGKKRYTPNLKSSRLGPAILKRKRSKRDRSVFGVFLIVDNSESRDCIAEEKQDLMDASTFIPPLDHSNLPTPLVVVEYCQRCKFGLRANWISQELLSTFAPQPASHTGASANIASVMLVPKVDPPSAGRFRVWFLAPALQSNHPGLQLVWDRKVHAGFPEMKVLKQKVRDLINPNFDLGHSDTK